MEFRYSNGIEIRPGGGLGAACRRWAGWDAMVRPPRRRACVFVIKWMKEGRPGPSFDGLAGAMTFFARRRRAVGKKRTCGVAWARPEVRAVIF